MSPNAIKDNEYRTVEFIVKEAPVPELLPLDQRSTHCEDSPELYVLFDAKLSLVAFAEVIQTTQRFITYVPLAGCGLPHVCVSYSRDMTVVEPESFLESNPDYFRTRLSSKSFVLFAVQIGDGFVILFCLLARKEKRKFFFQCDDFFVVNTLDEEFR